MLSAASGYVTPNELLGTVILCITISPAVLIYLGRSEEGTGNWCFKDGTISFQEIFDLYRLHGSGKRLRLTIHSDCCYSGNWVIECARTLDNLGIPPCGHKAMEKGIQIRMLASCQPNQKAAEPCYFVEGVTVEDDGNLVFTNKQASETQTFCGTDSTKLVCCRGPDEPCHSEEALRGLKWEDAVNHKLKNRVYFVQGKDRNQGDKNVWHLILLSSESEELMEKFYEKLKSGNIDVAKWGYNIESGYDDPSEDLKKKVPKWMDV